MESERALARTSRYVYSSLVISCLIRRDYWKFRTIPGIIKEYQMLWYMVQSSPTHPNQQLCKFLFIVDCHSTLTGSSAGISRHFFMMSCLLLLCGRSKPGSTTFTRSSQRQFLACVLVFHYKSSSSLGSCGYLQGSWATYPERASFIRSFGWCEERIR